MIKNAVRRWLGLSASNYDEGRFWGLVSDSARSSTGLAVTPETAMRVSAVMACVRVLGETVASLPLHVYRRLPDGKERATDHPLEKILNRQPNDWQTSFEFREMLMGHLTLRGNAYCEIIPGEAGSVTQLWPLHPDRVTVERLTNMRLRYAVRDGSGEPRYLRQDQVFHVRNMTGDGVLGMTPITMAREAIGLAMATEQYGGSLFKNRAMPGVILEHPGRLRPEASAVIRESWEQIHAGPTNAHRTAVLDEGMKAHVLGMTSHDAEFLENRKFQVVEIARVFRVPPHMIGDLEKATFSNIEQQSIDFVVHTIRPWLVRWEQAIQRDLVADDENYFCEYNVDGLLRGDSISRGQYYNTMFNIGAFSINDIRAKENLNPVPDGDTHFVPLNMQALEFANQPPEPAAPPAVAKEPDQPKEEQSDE